MTILSEAIRQFPVAESVIKQSYEGLQWSKGYFSFLHNRVSNQVRDMFYDIPEMQGISPALAEQLQKRVANLLEEEWADAKAGYYPLELLFDEAWQEFLQFYPQVCWDIPGTWERARHERNTECASTVEPEDYPDYYLQNFHHQTDGYLSESSANLYDVQVDLVFGGKADAMRRRILAPLKRSLTHSFADVAPRDLRLLDLACGTGRTLIQLRAAFPQAQLFGMDLSAAYLQKARQLLAQKPGDTPQFVAANAESCPYPDQSFHGVSNVFTLHELPETARHNVLKECYRVLKPGGVLVICDSIQYEDSSEFAPMMMNFATLMHEPYYEQYVQDDLTARLQTIGFSHVESSVHFFSKYLIAHKA